MPPSRRSTIRGRTRRGVWVARGCQAGSNDAGAALPLSGAACLRRAERAALDLQEFNSAPT